MPRVQIDLSAKELRRLEFLMGVCELQTKKEVFGNAFAVLEWMVKERQAGRDIYSAHPGSDDRYVLHLPALSNVEVVSNGPKKPRGVGSASKVSTGSMVGDGMIPATM
jgi:hypothetical protein